jgi:hypothetical protein
MASPWDRKDARRDYPIRALLKAVGGRHVAEPDEADVHRIILSAGLAITIAPRSIAALTGINLGPPQPTTTVLILTNSLMP